MLTAELAVTVFAPGLQPPEVLKGLLRSGHSIVSRLVWSAKRRLRLLAPSGAPASRLDRFFGVSLCGHGEEGG
jgi:hypothetical protein